jgi:TP901 family phage tail tape measure protein
MATNTEKIVVQIQIKGQRDLDKLGVKTDKATKKVGGLNNQFTKMAAKLVAAATAFRMISSVIGSSIKTFRDFEFQMAKVKAVTGASEKDFKKLSNTAKELGRTTFFTATQVAELQTNYAKLGFSTKEILDAQEATLKLATATDTDLGRAAIVAGAAIRGFGLDASEAGRVVDVMAEAFTSSALDIEKFQTSMTKVAPIAAAANISLEATTAIMGTLTDAGIEASIAGTSLRNIFLKMQDSSSDLSKFLGYTVNSSDDLERALNDLNKAGLTNEEVMSLVDLRQVAAFNTMIRGSERIQQLTDDFNDANGAASRMAAIVADTLEGSFKRLTSATEGLSIQLMEDLGGSLKETVNKLANFFNALTENSKGIATVVKGIVALVKWTGLFTVGVLAAKAGTILWRNAVILLNGTLKLTKAAIAQTGIGVFVVLLGEVASRFLLVGDAAETAAKKMEIFNIAKDRQLSREEDLMKLINQQLAETDKQSEKNLANIKVQIDGRTNLKNAMLDEMKAGMDDIKKKKEYKKEIKLINSELALLVSNQGLRMINQRKLIDNENQDILQTKSLITLAQEEMAILMRMPETTEQEIIDKNKLVDTLQLEIDRLKDLGREKDTQVEKNKELIEYNPYQSSLEDLEKLKEADKKLADQQIKWSKEAADQRIEDGERVLGQAKQTADMLFQIFNQNAANKTKRETKELEEQKDAGLISQEKYEEGVLKIEKAAFEKKKRLDIAQAIINGALAMTKVTAQTGVLAFAFSPFIAAMTAAQVAMIASQKFANGGMIEEFANGGLVQGKSHAQGGEKFAVGGRVVELEGGEAVINKRSTSMFSSQLSAMNAAGGGVKFADGGLLNQPSFSQQQFNSLGQNQMMGAMSNSGKVTVVEADITSSQNTVSVIQSQATI